MTGGPRRRSPHLDPRALARLVLAHHPVCHPFQADTYRLGRLHLCVGCFTTYPIALVALLVLVHLQPGPWWAWLASGLVLGSAQGLSVLGRTGARRRKVAVKVLLGFGLAGTVYGILAAPWVLGLRLAALGVGVLLATVAMLPRSRRLVRTCQGCFFQGDWERCPGMGLVRAPSPPGGRTALHHPQQL